MQEDAAATWMQQQCIGSRCATGAGCTLTQQGEDERQLQHFQTAYPRCTLTTTEKNFVKSVQPPLLHAGWRPSQSFCSLLAWQPRRRLDSGRYPGCLGIEVRLQAGPNGAMNLRCDAEKMWKLNSKPEGQTVQGEALPAHNLQHRCSSTCMRSMMTRMVCTSSCITATSLTDACTAARSTLQAHARTCPAISGIW